MPESLEDRLEKLLQMSDDPDPNNEDDWDDEEEDEDWDDEEEEDGDLSSEDIAPGDLDQKVGVEENTDEILNETEVDLTDPEA